MDLYSSTLTSDSLIEFVPRTGTIEQWDEACERLEDFFRAYGMAHKVHLHQVILRLLRKAADAHERNPTEQPTRVVMTLAWEEIESWHLSVLTGCAKSNGSDSENTAGDGQWVPDTASRRQHFAAFHLALRACDAFRRWPAAFPSNHEPPDDLVRAVKRHAIQPGPGLQLSSMVPRQIDIPPVFIDGEITIEKLSKLSLFLVVGAFLVLAFAVVALLRI
jgi:hypothetical protein